MLVKLFLSFLARYILTDQKVILRRWTIKQTFNSFEKREDIKALDHLMFFFYFLKEVIKLHVDFRPLEIYT